MRMVSVFASEAPGTGGGDSASKYIYFVEPLNSGDRVYLQRPAKGEETIRILKAIKWLFIEQDIRYWNYSGRNMTWGLVPPAD